MKRKKKACINEEPCNLHFSPMSEGGKLIRRFRSNTQGKARNGYKVLGENPEERDSVEDLHVDDKITL
jgi:hypothetical protein